MDEKSFEFKVCPSCGSAEFIEDYPAPGVLICEECGREVASVVLKVIQEAEEETVISESACPFCGAKNQTEDENILFSFSEANFRSGEILVFKCRVCGKLDGYRILPITFAIDDEVNEGNFDRKAVAIAKTEGHSI